MIVIKDNKYTSIKAKDLKPRDSIIVIDSHLVGFTYTQAQVVELMNKAYDHGFSAGDRNYKDNFVYSDHGDE